MRRGHCDRLVVAEARHGDGDVEGGWGKGIMGDSHFRLRKDSDRLIDEIVTRLRQNKLV